MTIIRYLQLCYLIARCLRSGYMPPRKPRGDIRNFARVIATNELMKRLSREVKERGV